MADYGFKSPYRGMGSALPEGYLSALMRANDGYAEGIKQATGAITEGINKYQKNKAERDTAQAMAESTTSAYLQAGIDRVWNNTSTNENDPRSQNVPLPPELAETRKAAIGVDQHNKVRQIVGDKLWTKMESGKGTTADYLAVTNAIKTYEGVENKLYERSRQEKQDQLAADVTVEQIRAAKSQNEFFSKSMRDRLEALTLGNKLLEQQGLATKGSNELANFHLEGLRDDKKGQAEFSQVLKDFPLDNTSNAVEWAAKVQTKLPHLFKTPQSVTSWMSGAAALQKNQLKPEMTTIGEIRDDNGKITDPGIKKIWWQGNLHNVPIKSHMPPGTVFYYTTIDGKPSDLRGIVNGDGTTQPVVEKWEMLRELMHNGKSPLGGGVGLDPNVINFTPPTSRP